MKEKGKLDFKENRRKKADVREDSEVKRIEYKWRTEVNMIKRREGKRMRRRSERRSEKEKFRVSGRRRKIIFKK